MKLKLSHTKIATNLNIQFPDLKIKSEYHNMRYISNEIVVTEMRIRSEIEKFEFFQNKINDWIIEKSWSSMRDDKTCPLCKENADVGWILISDSFPSGHLYAPTHRACRCNTQYRFKDSIKKTNLPDDRWLVEREGDTIYNSSQSKI